MPAPLAVAAAAAGRAAAQKAAQTAGARAAGSVGANAATGGRAAVSGPRAVEGRGSEFFKTERTLEQNISRRLDEARKRRWSRSAPQAANDNGSAANDNEAIAYEIAQMEEEEARAFSKISRLYQEQGENFSSEEAERLQGETAKSRPSFPVFIFSLALIKDLLDVPLDLSVVAALFASILSVFVGITLALWMFGKMSGAWYKRGMIKWFWRRFALVMIIEFIPGLQLIPANTVLVWMAHNRENKAVQLLNNALEVLHGRGFGPQRR